ncbi:MAG TPA: hypothetical protein VI454_01280 [Verrucomicrobiae bacterium]|jgi:hypothetical protein
MTTQALAQAITLRQQMPLEDLLQFAPQLAAYVGGQPMTFPDIAGEATQADTERAFWATFSFGCLQALVLFSLIYAYFAL